MNTPAANFMKLVRALRDFAAPGTSVHEDDRRLMVSGMPVLFFCAFVFAAVYAEPNCELDRLLGFATGYCARARKRDAAPGVVTERAVAKQAAGTRTGVSVKSASIRAVAHSTG